MSNPKSIPFKANIAVERQIYRPADRRKTFGISPSTENRRVKDGLLPPHFNLGGRAVGCCKIEDAKVIDAMVSGASNDEIRNLVSEIVEQRKLAK